MANEETISEPPPAILLNPGGRLQPGPRLEGSPAIFWDAQAPTRPGSLVLAAGSLLALAARLKFSIEHEDIAGLRERVLREVEVFERRIVPLGLAPRSVRAARYALCATLDDVVLNTPWGSRSLWTQRSLVGSLFSETWGGDRFFDLLAHLKRDPAIHVDLLELLYYCLSLGFEGRLRLAPRGASELAALREDLHRLVRAARGPFERDLSPQWRGATLGRSGRRAVPAWLMVLGAVAAMAAIYGTLLLALNARSDTVFAALGTLPPRGPVSLSRVAPPPPPPPAPEAGRARILRFLEPEIRAGLVTVTESLQALLVTISGSGIYASGSARVEAEFESLFRRIGEALNGQPGRVAIIGHTDSTPIRTIAFPSNFQLSLERARSAARIIAAPMDEPDRLRTQGLGETQPAADNATEEGRRRNRRIEIVISKAD